MPAPPDPAAAVDPADATEAARCARRLHAAAAALSRQLRQPADRQLLSPARLSVLGQLYRAGALTPSELARREQVRLQTLTRLLAELEGQGCLLRSPHPSDARQSLLSLTPAGRQLLGGAVRGREQALAAAIAHALRPDEAAQLLAACALIERVADGLAGRGDGDAAAVPAD